MCRPELWWRGLPFIGALVLLLVIWRGEAIERRLVSAAFGLGGDAVASAQSSHPERSLHP